uniref:Protein arginine N-methyltransferase domain-containing protein n=1 Tax=Amphimedon queenslandica TaxID=400682 RepID=A0A1X7SWJ9_AMPQE
LVGYFVIGFEVPSYPVYFSTSPQDTPTHWHQRIFFLNEPIQVQTGGPGLRLMYTHYCLSDIARVYTIHEYLDEKQVF